MLAAHLLHSGALWEPEVFPLAAALQLKRGAALYRDVWFDKPPLSTWIYLLWGAAQGPVLRIAGAVYDLLACGLVFHLAATLWTRREGYLAAGLLAFCLTFDTQAAVLPLGADLLLLVPHLAAMLFAVRKQPLLAGMAAGAGFLMNAKGVFVLAGCAVFLWPSLPLLVVGFLIPCGLGLAALSSVADWYEQAWRWPALYAASPVVSDPVRNGLLRTGNWLGFHVTLAVGAGCYYYRNRDWRMIAWALLALAGVVLGWRFFPRYFFLLLPALLVPASRGLVNYRKPLAAVAWLALIIPLARFGPKYFVVATSPDLAMDRDSREASRLALQFAKPGSTLYVWGYRPELFVYTGLPAATKYIDSQALTGVPADRHLTQSTRVLKEGTHEAREELARARPEILMDGLSLFNPNLSMEHYAELRPWLSNYREVARTKGIVIYTRTQ